jgi:VWFA-related protein
VARDVAVNDINDQLGDGRLYAIVIDDRNIPWDNLDIIQATRALAHYIIESLAPSDIAAVIYTQDAGRGEDFTDDRDKLRTAVNRLEPHPAQWVFQQPMLPGPGGGDMPQRFSPVLNRSTCQRTQPAVPTLDTVAARLASIPKRRKTVFFVSTGVPLDLGATRDCPGVLADEMRDVFRLAQRANVNIYGIDPGGFRGYESYMFERMSKLHRMDAVSAASSARRSAQFVHDFLEITAENTGARAVVSNDNLESEVERVFNEDSTYYLLGYQTSNTDTDGKFRRIQVKVNRPGSTVRARSGYWGAKDGKFAMTERNETAPTTVDLGLSGLMDGPALPLRAVATPVALAAPTDKPGARRASVAVILTVKVPNPRQPIPELLTVIRNIYDADGKTSSPVREMTELTLQPTAAEEARYDVYKVLDLVPGRYQIRLNAHSKALDKGSTVYADVEVRDFSALALSITGVILGAPSAGPRTDALAGLVPIVPTSARDFSPVDRVAAFVRIFQGGTAPLAPVSLKVEVLDSHDVTKFETTATLGPEAFDATRGAPYQFDLPLSKLEHGPQLLSITAKVGSVTERRDLVFRVR